MDSLNNDNFSKDADEKAIELLKHLCGVDDRSDEPCYENVNAAEANDALNIITKSIADNDYDDKYVQHCMPLLNIFGKN